MATVWTLQELSLYSIRFWKKQGLLSVSFQHVLVSAPWVCCYQWQRIFQKLWETKEILNELYFALNPQVSLYVAWTWHFRKMSVYASTSFASVTTLPMLYGGLSRGCCSGWKSKPAKSLTLSPQTWQVVRISSQQLSSSIFQNKWKNSGISIITWCLLLFIL